MDENDSVKNWDDEFYATMQLPLQQRGETLTALLEEFTKTAEAVVKVIITESALGDDNLRTIKSCDAGGIAGGMDYHHRNNTTL